MRLHWKIILALGALALSSMADATPTRDSAHTFAQAIRVADTVASMDKRAFYLARIAEAQARAGYRKEAEKTLGKALVLMEYVREQDASVPAEQIALAQAEFGIISNGQVWQFHQLTRDGDVYETEPYTIRDLPDLLGALDYICAKCVENIP